MKPIPRSDYKYHVGGSLPTNAPTYVRRSSDEDFYSCLKRGEFCYVLNSRQMGKSSLRVQTMQRLENDGFACAAVDITAIGTADITPVEWYAGIIDYLVESFNLYTDFELKSWWQDNALLSPVQHFSKFIETVLLERVEQNIIIFIDEIDSILSLEFNLDDFFAVIRDCYNRRASQGAYSRLTFALLGVSTPSDLIQDWKRTPFNIGRAINLTGFQLSEAEPLAQGLAKLGNPTELMQAVLNWTGGQPFLTQKVCRLLLSEAGEEEENPSNLVERLVRKRIIDNWEAQDEPEHLKTIRDRILLGFEKRKGRLLGLCQQILTSNGQGIGALDSPEQTQLRLTGLVVKQDGRLKIYNCIYESVFNLTWVEQELTKLRPYSDAIDAWMASNCKDESRLLRGQALQDALLWASDKGLSDEDNRFLRASQELDKQEVAIALDAERQAKEILATAQAKAQLALEEERQANQRLIETQKKAELALSEEKQANQRLTEAQRKTQRQVRVGTGILAVSVIGAIVASLVAGKAIQEQRFATSKLNKAQQDLSFVTDQKTQAENATQKAQEAEKKALEAEKQAISKAKTADSNLKTATQEVEKKNQQLQQATLRLNSAEEKVQKAQGDAQQAQQELQQAQTEVNTAETARQTALAGLERAKQQQKQAQQQVRTAQNERKQAQTARQIALNQLKQAQRELQTAEIARKQAETERQYALTATRLERDGVNILRQFQGGGEIASLQLAMRAGQELKSLVKDKKSLADYPAYSPVFSLQEILLNIRERNQLQGHQNRVNSVAFSPDGKTLASASWDNSIKLWNVATGKQIISLTGHQDITSIAFSPDGKTLASASLDIKLWDITTGKEIPFLTSSQKTVRLPSFKSVTFSPDGRTLASASEDGTIKLWNVATGEEIVFMSGHQNYVNSVAFSPDGKTLASASSDKTIKLWNVKTFKEIITLIGHQNYVNSVAFSPDGKTLASASSDKTIKLWDVSTLKEIATLTGHQYNIKSVAFSSDGKTLASASLDKTIKLWDVSTLKEIASLSGHQDGVNSVAFSPDGKTLVSASYDKTIKLWNIATDKETTPLIGHQDGVNSVAFSPDGKTLASASYDKTIKLWNVATGKEITPLIGHQEIVKSVAFSPDGKSLASAGNDKTIKLWNIATGKEIFSLNGHKNYVNSVAFSPDGKTLASASYDNATVSLGKIIAPANDTTIKLWNVITGKKIASLITYTVGVNSVTFSPDGKTLASASSDKTIKLWNIATGKEIVSLAGHQEMVNSVAFSPDSKTLASASSDKTIKLWNVSTGKEIVSLAGHQNNVNSVAFSPDGKTLASASWDRTIKLWNVATGKEIASLSRHQYGVNSVAFSPNGKTLASASVDGAIKLLSLDLDDLRNQGCRYLENYFTTYPDTRKDLCP